MMGSRIRDNVKHYFECFCEVVGPQAGREDAWIIQKFPENYCDQEVLKSVPKFVFPCEFDSSVVQHFSFVLTSHDSKWTFGFCRHDPKSETALVVLSYLPWHESFSKFLNCISELTHSAQSDELWKFLDAVYQSKVPDPGSSFKITINNGRSYFICQSPSQFQLPSIPENRNLTEYYNAVDSNNMMIIFASMLYERRIIFTSKRLNRLSACVQSANAIIYPMNWQHIFIPVLPQQLVDYLLAPMPYLIGVPHSLLNRVRRNDMGDVVILDADNNSIETPFKDLESLPQDVVKSLRAQLRNRAALLGDGVSRAFLRALVQLIGGYRDALRFHQGEKITFSQDAFVESRPPSMQPFLRKMLELQIFQQFIEERLDMLNAGLGFSDEFEMEACNYSDKTSSRLKQQYKEWTYTMKKEGSAFFKSVKSRANPAVRSAVKTVKERGKHVGKAYKGIKSKFRDMQPPGTIKGGLSNEMPVSPLQNMSASTSHSHSSIIANAAASYRRDLSIRQRMSATSDIGHYSSLSPSSPDATTNSFQLSPLDMDLMGDLQDVIFRNYSSAISSSVGSPAVDRTLKPVRSLENFSCEAGLESDNLSTSSDLFGVSPFIGRSGTEEEAGTQDDICLISKNDSDIGLPPPKASGSSRAVSKVEERDLICLDSSPSIEDFDPLLSKEDTEKEHVAVNKGLSLTNPLYPYFTPTHSTSAHRDQDLLKEYGIDFNSLSVHSQPSSSLDFKGLNLSSSASESFHFPMNTVQHKQVNWTKFD